jgi:hypothetical protein
VRLLVEHLDEQAADDLALGFRVGDAGERCVGTVGSALTRITFTPMCSANISIT